ncbi:MAG: AAA family ATPase [Oscillospiraceae bacterium]|nr:AAA family ATPase [Oscillospiraceae bacterium]
MRIYKMTATFGKLEHETLTLEPGLNILQAPNEWGKSTWCAFLIAMLYGLDTRAKSTKTSLADKERYAPWSGSPMAGRIDLNWNGRDITIERKTRGRIPMGDFRAYETATGLDVPELTAQNCGQTLLGVEQSVFRRAGFIKLTDMPVTQDDALRRRLNDLVTTGDESGDGERLARELRELKNRCRYNRSGLIPQAEEERAALEGKLLELGDLETQSRKLKARLGEVNGWLRQLENHRTALDYAAAEDDAQRVAESRESWEQAEAHLAETEAACAKLPTREETERKLKELRAFREQWNAARMEDELLPDAPQPPEPPAPFGNMDMEHGAEMLRQDAARLVHVRTARPQLPFFLLAALCLIGGIALLVMKEYLFGGTAVFAAVLLLIFGFGRKNALRREGKALEEKYGSPDPADWEAALDSWRQDRKAYEAALLDHRVSRGDLDIRMTFLKKQRASLCGEQDPETVTAIWQQMMDKWEDYYAACREAQRAEKFLKTLQSMAKAVEKPAFPDELTYSNTDTARLVSDALAEQQRLLGRIGQYRGRMDALGDAGNLEKELLRVNGRIQRLEQTYEALTLALDTLGQAKKELQRRFAPRISRRAQELLKRLTRGRYDRLTLGEDLSLHAGAGEEGILREALWRSDGTIDQLYLALRLAVAEELTPNAPLVLDDALVRFDDDRLRAALEVLGEMAKEKQVILFTCQGREKGITQ